MLAVHSLAMADTTTKQGEQELPRFPRGSDLKQLVLDKCKERYETFFGDEWSDAIADFVRQWIREANELYAMEFEAIRTLKSAVETARGFYERYPLVLMQKEHHEVSINYDTPDGVATWYRPDPTRWQPDDGVGVPFGVFGGLLHSEHFEHAVNLLHERMAAVDTAHREPKWTVRTAVVELWGHGTYDDGGKLMLGFSTGRGRPVETATLAAISLLTDYRPQRLEHGRPYSASEVIGQETTDMGEALKRSEKRLELRRNAAPESSPSSR